MFFKRCDLIGYAYAWRDVVIIERHNPRDSENWTWTREKCILVERIAKNVSNRVSKSWSISPIISEWYSLIFNGNTSTLPPHLVSHTDFDQWKSKISPQNLYTINLSCAVVNCILLRLWRWNCRLPYHSGATLSAFANHIDNSSCYC